MPQLQNVVITDRQSPTPTDHTFVPSDIAQPGSVGILYESTNGALMNAPQLSISSRKTTGSKLKGRLVLKFPIVQAINGVDTIVRTGYVSVETTFDLSSTQAERNNAIGMIASALATGKVLVNDTLVKGEAVY